MDIYGYWKVVMRQDADGIRQYFEPYAYINWHCTNERFTVEEFIRTNCEYPGEWDGNIERTEQAGDIIITAVRVFSKTEGASFHAVSFIKAENDKIVSVDEYWGDDGAPPLWRQEMNIGKSIAEVSYDE